MSIPYIVDGETDADSTTINAWIDAINGLRAVVRNVSDYASPAAAIAAASAGDTIYFPAGVYTLKNAAPYTAGLSITKSLTLRADRGAILRADPTSPDGIRMVAISADDVTIDGLTFDPNGIPSASCNYLANASFVQITNCHFDDPKSGAMLLDGNVTDVQFVNNRVRGLGYGVLANDQAGHERIIVVNNTFDGEGGSGDAIEFNGITNTHTDISVIGNTVLNYASSSEHAGFGIGFARVHRGVIQGNTVDTASRAGIHVEHLSNGVIVRGNTVANCDHAGIEVQGESGGTCTNIVIDGNYVENCTLNPSLSDVLLGRGGIDIGFSVSDWLNGFGARQVIVSNNIIDGCQGAGIYLTSVTNSNVTGNIIRNIYGDSVDTVHAVENVGIHAISCDRTRFIGNLIVDTQGGSATTYYPMLFYGSAVSLYAYMNHWAGTLGGSRDLTTGISRALGLETHLQFGPGAKIGFYGTTPGSRPTITGSRGSNAALASLLTQLASLGLITDSTS